MGGGHILTGKISTNGQLSVATVNQNCQLNSLRTTHINNSIQSATNSAASVKNIIYQNNSFAIQIEVDFGAMANRVISQGGQIIAIQGNIQHAYRQLHLFNLINSCCQALSNGHTTGANTN